MSLTLGSRHLGDDDLIRYMDHQLDREGARRMGVHLRTCAECTARLDEMQRRAAAVSELLAQMPVEVPDAGKRAVAMAAVERARFRGTASGPIRSTVWLKAAAVVLLLLTGALVTQPGRAWVADGVVSLSGGRPGPVAMRLLGWLGESPQAVAAAPVQETTVAAQGRPAQADEMPRPAPRPRSTPSGSSPPVRFEPRGPDVLLVFRTLQDGGSATLWLRDVPSASGRVTGGLHGETLVPTLDGIEVRNTRGSHADYELVVPTRFRFIRVRVGDGPEMLIRSARGKQDWIWTINLRNSALQ